MAASAAARLVSLKVVFASRPASAAHGRPVSPAAPATATAAAAAAFAADFYSSCTKSGVLAAAFRNSGHRQHRLQGELLLLGSEPAAAATATTAWADADLSLVPGFLKQRRRLHISAFRWQGEIPGQPLQGEQPVAAVAAPTAAASAVGALHSAAYAGIGVRAVSGATGAPLQLRSGFAASPPPRRPTQPRRWRMWAKVLLFGAVSVSPIVAATLIFNSLLLKRQQQEEEAAVAATSKDAALKRAQQIVANCLSCICMAGGTQDGGIAAVGVEPHLPESRVLRLPSKEVIAGIENNSLTYLLAGERSAFSLPFNFIHFALSSSSQVYKQLQQGQPLTLLYVDAATGDSLLLRGVAAVVESAPYKAHYWRSCWAATLPGGQEGGEYRLVKFVPSSIAIDLGIRGVEKWRPIELHRVISKDDIHWELEKDTKPLAAVP